ncbi:MAG: hypothetical protein M1819_002336 [Sarea resinae]|nr:MAG: hypothetical protein M1819_002336 [Sarea resinae]
MDLYRSLSSSEAQKLGQQYYRRKDYKEALKAFTVSLELAEDSQVLVLDNRAATHEKLDDLTAALRDARRMIQLEKACINGYLRVGKILLNMEKPEVALNVYQYGLRNVPSDDPHYELLRAMERKVASRLKPKNAKDPLSMLPLELAELIMKELDFKNIVRCLRVSKGWNMLLSSLPSLWSHLDLSIARKPVRLSAIRACIRRSKDTMISATLNRVAVQDSNILKTLTSACRKLEYLDIRSGFSGASVVEAVPLARNLHTLILGNDTEITLDSVTQILNNSKSMVRAEFPSVYSSGTYARWSSMMGNLQVLRLGGGPRQNPQSRALNLSELLPLIPNVTTLYLTNWAKKTTGFPFDGLHLTRLTSLVLTAIPLLGFPRLPPSLVNLTLSDMWSLHLPSNDMERDLNGTSLVNLKSLVCDDSKVLGIDTLNELLRVRIEGRCVVGGNLTSLSLSRCELIHGPGLEYFFTYPFISHLSHLSLAGNQDFGDKYCFYLADLAPCLQSLDISHTRVTGVGIKALVLKHTDQDSLQKHYVVNAGGDVDDNEEGLVNEEDDEEVERKRIEYLNLDGCVSVGLDAVQMARKMGVVVSFRFPENSRGAKRVRYG